MYTVSSDLIEAFSKTVDDIEETTKATAKNSCGFLSNNNSYYAASGT